MANPRLFLVAPQSLDDETLKDCVKAACAAGDVASIIIPAEAAGVTRELQALGVAVLGGGHEIPAGDGIHITADDDVPGTRRKAGSKTIVGVYCAASRHAAMQAAEDGADYIAFSQTQPAPKEPIIGWWSELFEIPCVAFDPVTIEALDILLPQNPDFIRPDDAMWAGPEAARRIVADMMKRMVT